MSDYSIWILETQNTSVSGGKTLSGMTQGRGGHLTGETVTFENRDWVEIDLRDNTGDTTFDDNDATQVLRGDQTINGTPYTDGTIVEAEYVVVLRDPNTLIEYVGVTVNINDSSPSYATIEGIAIIGDGGFPPDGVAFTVVSVDEGPGSINPTIYDESEFTFPICFTPGTMISTPDGLRPVDVLAAGDLILTRDNGAQPVQWVGRSDVSPADVRARSAFRPVRIAAGALGTGVPTRELIVSQQHRILMTGWKADLFFGKSEVLVAARHLVGRPGITLEEAAEGVSYLHVMLEAHEIIMANGTPAETFFPGAAALETLSPDARADLARHLEAGGITPAREALRAWEAAALVG